MMLLNNRPEVITGAGSGGRALVETKRKLDFSLGPTIIADRQGDKFHTEFFKTRLPSYTQYISAAGETIIPKARPIITRGIVDNLGSVQRIGDAMRTAKAQGTIATIIPVSNKAETVAILHSFHPDAKQRTSQNPVVEMVKRLPQFERDAYLGLAHKDGGFFNPLSGRLNPPEYLQPMSEMREKIAKFELKDEGESAKDIGPYQIGILHNGKMLVFGIVPKIFDNEDEAIRTADYYGMATVTQNGKIFIPSDRESGLSLKMFDIKFPEYSPSSNAEEERRRAASRTSLTASD